MLKFKLSKLQKKKIRFITKKFLESDGLKFISPFIFIHICYNYLPSVSELLLTYFFHFILVFFVVLFLSVDTLFSSFPHLVEIMSILCKALVDYLLFVVITILKTLWFCRLALIAIINFIFGS